MTTVGGFSCRLTKCEVYDEANSSSKSQTSPGCIVIVFLCEKQGKDNKKLPIKWVVRGVMLGQASHSPADRHLDFTSENSNLHITRNT